MNRGPARLRDPDPRPWSTCKKVLSASATVELDPLDAGIGVVAAVVLAEDLWFEWRIKADDGRSVGFPDFNAGGLWIRKSGTLVDAHRQTCATVAFADWAQDEMNRVTLGPGRVLRLPDAGIAIGAVESDGAKMHFEISFGESAPCSRGIPQLVGGQDGFWNFRPNAYYPDLYSTLGPLLPSHTYKPSNFSSFEIENMNKLSVT